MQLDCCEFISEVLAIRPTESSTEPISFFPVVMKPKLDRNIDIIPCEEPVSMWPTIMVLLVEDH